MSKTPMEHFMDDIRDAMPCCVNCEHFSKSVWSDPKKTQTVEYCERDAQKRPIPAKVAAFGCPYFSKDIPF